jgi:3-oxoacyl-[acyl-carrier-protein] synthase II
MTIQLLVSLVACLCLVADAFHAPSSAFRRASSLSMKAHKKIVVTGLGIVCPVGVGADEAYTAMCEGKSGIVRLPSWADEYPSKLAGLVKADAKSLGIKSKVANRNGRYTHFALAAAKQALEDADLDTSKVDKSRFGCIVGSGIGGVEWFEDNCNAFTKAGGNLAGLRAVDVFLIPALIANTASGMIAIEHGAQGPNCKKGFSLFVFLVYFHFIIFFFLFLYYSYSIIL